MALLLKNELSGADGQSGIANMVSTEPKQLKQSEMRSACDKKLTMRDALHLVGDHPTQQTTILQSPVPQLIPCRGTILGKDSMRRFQPTHQAERRVVYLRVHKCPTRPS